MDPLETDVATLAFEHSMQEGRSSKLVKVTKFLLISALLFPSSFTAIPARAAEIASFDSVQNLLTLPAVHVADQGSYRVEMSHYSNGARYHI